MDRDLVYRDLAGEVEGLATTVDRELYVTNRLSILLRVTALTDAVVNDVMGMPEAKRYLEGYVESLRNPTEQMDTNEIKF